MALPFQESDPSLRNPPVDETASQGFYRIRRTRLLECTNYLFSFAPRHGHEIWINILKCSLAYTLATLFTFVPSLAHLVARIGASGRGDDAWVPSRAGHMAATVYELVRLSDCCHTKL